MHAVSHRASLVRQRQGEKDSPKEGNEALVRSRVVDGALAQGALEYALFDDDPIDEASDDEDHEPGNRRPVPEEYARRW
jgi:hypothetical protein